jgi:uncharacterized repeat protein (TIGR01451 family)
LAIAKTDNQATAVPGTPVTYSIVVTNTGAVTVTNAAVADAFPASLTGVTWSCTPSAGSSCTSGSGDINTTVTLAPGGTVTFTASGSILASATGILVNIASVAAPIGVADTNLANNSQTDTDTLTPVADLSISKSDTPDPVNAGATLTYTLSVNNAGPSMATSVTVTDTLPGGVTFGNATGSGWSCGENSGVVTCTRANLGVGAAPNIVITVTAPANGGNITNNAGVTSTTTDANPGNNTTSADTTVTPVADLSITKTDTPDPVNANVTLTYTLSVNNAGPSTATSVTVTDPLPPGMSFVGATGTGWACSTGVSGVTCARANLAVGAAPDITLVATAPLTNGTLVNQATVSTATNDPNAANDVASTSTTVLTVLANYQLFLPLILRAP